MQIHPMAQAFVLIEGKEFEELVASVKKHGLREKITTYEKQVIDGVNRQRACEAAKKTPSYKEWEPPDPFAKPEEIRRELYFFIRDKNCTRRHESVSQRALSAATLRDLAGLTLVEAARDFDVSERSVASAAKVVERGVPEVVEAVKKNAIPVSVGAAISQLPAAEPSKPPPVQPPQQ